MYARCTTARLHVLLHLIDVRAVTNAFLILTSHGQNQSNIYLKWQTLKDSICKTNKLFRSHHSCMLINCLICPHSVVCRALENIRICNECRDVCVCARFILCANKMYCLNTFRSVKRQMCAHKQTQHQQHQLGSYLFQQAKMILCRASLVYLCTKMYIYA